MSIITSVFIYNLHVTITTEWLNSTLVANQYGTAKIIMWYYNNNLELDEFLRVSLRVFQQMKYDFLMWIDVNPPRKQQALLFKVF